MSRIDIDSNKIFFSTCITVETDSFSGTRSSTSLGERVATLSRISLVSSSPNKSLELVLSNAFK